MNDDVSSSVEQRCNLGVDSRHDHVVEERNQSSQRQTADNNGNDDLDGGVNVTLAGGVQRSCLSMRAFSLAASFAWNALKISLFLMFFMIESS